MPSTTLDAEAIYSDYGADPDLADLVELFVEEIPDRLATLERALASRDWEAARTLAHQLKGAAGSYGFRGVTPYAAELENALRRPHDEPGWRAAWETFCSACRRLRPGLQ